MSQGARTVFVGTIEVNQYLPLTARPPSLILISLQVSAGSSGIDPKGTKTRKYMCTVKMSHVATALLYH